jgi:hypothetical protein
MLRTVSYIKNKLPDTGIHTIVETEESLDRSMDRSPSPIKHLLSSDLENTKKRDK